MLAGARAPPLVRASPSARLGAPALIPGVSSLAPPGGSATRVALARDLPAAAPARRRAARLAAQAMPADAEPALRLLNGGVGDECAEGLHRAIASHLFSVGHAHAARLLLREAKLEAMDDACDGGIAGLGAHLAAYERLAELTRALDERNLTPALAWADAHAAALAARGADLGFALHRLRFLQLLDGCGSAADGADGASAISAALAYGRAFLAPAADSSTRLLGEVQQLMGTLLFVGRLDSSPYAALLDGSHWRAAREQLRAEFLAIHKLPDESPLAVSLRVGVLALPTLVKVANVLQAKVGARAPGSYDRLPVELELPSEFTYHSIVTCPVSREQCTRDNPPMLLPCGHVISLISTSKLSRGCRTARFKCPYCPVETTTALCQKLCVD